MNNTSIEKKNESKSGALFVALGIFLSRIAGLIRQRVFAHYFGNSDAADAFNAAYKIPNFLQNLFGEGVLSASFIPVYAQLLASQNQSDNQDGIQNEAGKIASTILSILFLLTAILVLCGVILTPSLIGLIAPGFQGEKKILTIKLVQIIFPGTGLLVMCAWCLGILNSHRKFFLSYAAPVIWNFAIIGVMLFFGRTQSQFELAKYLSYGLVLGSFLQFLVQFPTAIRLIPHFKIAFEIKNKHIKLIVKNFFPVVISRGVVQLSAYIDSMLASLLPTGAVSALAYAQLLYMLPISLFGMSVTAAELPAMSSLTGSKDEIFEKLRIRLTMGLNRIAFFIIPSVCAFLILGDVIIGALFQSGEFKKDSTIFVWIVLIGSTVGLLASTLGRLYSSTFYALKDTRTPLKFAIVRVFLTTILGYLFAFTLPTLLSLEKSLGTAGLTASAGLAGWIEFYYLRKSLNKKIGKTGLTLRYQAILWASALVSGGFAFFLKTQFPFGHLIKAFLVLTFYGAFYFGITYFFNINESKNTIEKIFKKFRLMK